MSKSKTKIYDYECFGFFNASETCDTCPATKRCRSILASDGTDMMSDLLDELIEREVKSGVGMPEVHSAKDFVKYLLDRKARQNALTAPDVLSELFENDGNPGNSSDPLAAMQEANKKSTLAGKGLSNLQNNLRDSMKKLSRYGEIDPNSHNDVDLD